MALRVRGDALEAHTGVDLAQIGPASRLVERLTGYPVPPNKAIVGRERVRARGRHPPGRDAQGRATYQIIDPAELGLTMSLPLGKHSGRHAFARACEEAGLSSTPTSCRGVRPLQGARRRGPRRVHPRARRGGDRDVTTYSVACLSGDGIGPEVMAQASRGMRAAVAAARLRGRRAARAVRRGRAMRVRATRSRPRRGRRARTPTRSSPRPSTVAARRRSRASSTCAPRSCASGCRAAAITLVAPLRADAWEWALDRAASAARSRGDLTLVGSEDGWEHAADAAADRDDGLDVSTSLADVRSRRWSRSRASFDVVVCDRRCSSPLAELPGAATRTACSPGAGSPQRARASSARATAPRRHRRPGRRRPELDAARGGADARRGARRAGRRRRRSRRPSRTCSATAPRRRRHRLDDARAHRRRARAAAAVASNAEFLEAV